MSKHERSKLPPWHHRIDNPKFLMPSNLLLFKKPKAMVMPVHKPQVNLKVSCRLLHIKSIQVPRQPKKLYYYTSHVDDVLVDAFIELCNISTKSTIHLIRTLAAQATQSPPALPTATHSEFVGSSRPQIGVFPTLGVFPCRLAILRRSYPAISHLTTGPPRHCHPRKMFQEGSSTLMGLFRIWMPTSGWTQETSNGVIAMVAQ